MLIGLLQPILYLTLFGPLLQNIAATSGFQGDAWQVFVPGLLVQLGIFGGLFVGFGIIAEWRSGVIERQLVTPGVADLDHHRAHAARRRGDRGAGGRAGGRGVSCSGCASRPARC